jgi:hypothetical protein
MHRSIAMGNVRTAGCALVLFGSLVLCASSVWGQACTPVVYAFRHAEDTNPPDHDPLMTLTPTGTAHAALYPTMISDFQAANHFCPVTKVYATTKEKKVDQSASTTNPFYTAQPLANAVMSKDPITTVMSKDPITMIVKVKQLYEFLDDVISAPTKPNYSTLTAVALRTELLATANRGESSAIFWTSQGLHVLGGAIINATSIVPDKNAAINPVTPPRNAVYLFEAIGSAPTITRFSDIRAPSLYIQCFNHVEYMEQINPKVPQFTQAYYCGYGNQSNLGGSPDKSCPVGDQCGSTIPNNQNKDIKGKICDTTHLSPDLPPAKDTFGACN